MPSPTRVYVQGKSLPLRQQTLYFPQCILIEKNNLVLDRDTFRLELDYRSIMHILVKVLYNQDPGTRMALEQVRVQVLSLGMVA